MASRRARIKGVSALPPRRKNNDNGEDNKPSIIKKDEVDKPPDGPTPHSEVKNQVILGRNSPIAKRNSPVKSPLANYNVVSPSRRIQSPINFKEGSKHRTVSPETKEKEFVFSSPPSNRPLFLSPRSVGSPIRKSVTPTPRACLVEPEVQRPSTPEQFTETLKHNNSKEQNLDIYSIEKTVTPRNTYDSLEDYNVPSVPESVTDDEGILPYQPICTTPKHSSLLKKESISENAEALFDPIVPLPCPSPSKARPKLRPIPRLNPNNRRNSIQGSASESEDESRRAHLNTGPPTPIAPRQRTESFTSISTMVSVPKREVPRVRNDSVCSAVSQITNHCATPASPIKEKHLSKSRRQEASRRMAAMRRRRESVKRDALTMYDLIFYNPTSNPIIPDEEELKAKEANEKEKEKSRATVQEAEENPDDPPSSDPAPVPQIKLGPNGEIILDEQSLVIKQSSENRKISSVVVEGSWTGLGSARYKRGPRTAEWKDEETVRFYRALAALGTDFTLMERLFPGRTRRDLKLKFKKEERINCAQVDKALRTLHKWDLIKLEEEFKVERKASEERANLEVERLKQRAKDERERRKSLKELHVRQSKASKAMESSILPDIDRSKKGLTADDFIRNHLETKSQNTARKRKSRAEQSISQPVPIAPIAPAPPPHSPYAQLSMINSSIENRRTPIGGSMATIQKTSSSSAPPRTPELLNSATGVPSNIESGSLVVLTVDDPASPSKKMLQTYIAHGGGKLTPVALPPNLLSSVVSYMKRGAPRSAASDASSPCSAASERGSRSTTPGVVVHSPTKRKRLSSYTITPL